MSVINTFTYLFSTKKPKPENQKKQENGKKLIFLFPKNKIEFLFHPFKELTE
jgi:hypothetical protein